MVRLISSLHNGYSCLVKGNQQTADILPTKHKHFFIHILFLNVEASRSHDTLNIIVLELMI